MHVVGCPKEADPRNETCDCARLRAAVVSKFNPQSFKDAVRAICSKEEVLAAIKTLRDKVSSFGAEPIDWPEQAVCDNLDRAADIIEFPKTLGSLDEAIRRFGVDGIEPDFNQFQETIVAYHRKPLFLAAFATGEDFDSFKNDNSFDTIHDLASPNGFLVRSFEEARQHFIREMNENLTLEEQLASLDFTYDQLTWVGGEEGNLVYEAYCPFNNTKVVAVIVMRQVTLPV